jgi:hypothetical protein
MPGLRRNKTDAMTRTAQSAIMRQGWVPLARVIPAIENDMCEAPLHRIVPHRCGQFFDPSTVWRTVFGNTISVILTVSIPDVKYEVRPSRLST